MKKVFRIFEYSDYSHHPYYGAPRGSSIEMMPLWKDAYAGVPYEFTTLEQAEEFIYTFDFTKHKIKIVELAILPIYQ
jgi:hypothetical protein